MNLDRHFRRDSKARRVAEKLLSGRPMTRQELTEDTGVAVTTVNRVVEVLEEMGARVVREVADDGRQAVFRVTGVGEPRRSSSFPRLQEETRVVGARIVGDELLLDFSGDRGSRYRGVLKTLSRNLPLGKDADVVGVSLGERDTATVTLAPKGDGSKHLTVEHVQNVTADED